MGSQSSLWKIWYVIWKKVVFLHFGKYNLPNFGQIHIYYSYAELLDLNILLALNYKILWLKKAFDPIWKLYMHNISCFLDTAWRQALLLPIISSFLDIGTILCIVGSNFLTASFTAAVHWAKWIFDFRFKYCILSFKFISIIKLKNLFRQVYKIDSIVSIKFLV